MDNFEAPVGPAVDLPATRRGLHRIVGRWAFVGVVALVLLALGVWRWIDRDEPVSGPHTSGTVIEVVTRVVGWGRTNSGVVTVEFDIEGQTRRSTVRVGDIGKRFAAGDVIDVEYDASNPDRVALDGHATRASGLPAISLVGLGAVVALAAGFGLRKARWIHRIVADYAWVPVTSAFIEIPVTLGWRERSHTLVRLWDASGPVVVERADVGIMPPSLVPIAWVAGLGRSRFVVAAPGGADLIPVKPVRLVAKSVPAEQAR